MGGAGKAGGRGWHTVGGGTARVRGTSRAQDTVVGGRGACSSPAGSSPAPSLLLLRRQLLVTLRDGPLEVQHLRRAGGRLGLASSAADACTGSAGGPRPDGHRSMSSSLLLGTGWAASPWHQLDAPLTWYLSLLFSVSSCTDQGKERGPCQQACRHTQPVLHKWRCASGGGGRGVSAAGLRMLLTDVHAQLRQQARPRRLLVPGRLSATALACMQEACCCKNARTSPTRFSSASCSALAATSTCRSVCSSAM